MEWEGLARAEGCGHCESGEGLSRMSHMNKIKTVGSFVTAVQGAR